MDGRILDRVMMPRIHPFFKSSGPLLLESHAINPCKSTGSSLMTLDGFKERFYVCGAKTLAILSVL